MAHPSMDPSPINNDGSHDFDASEQSTDEFRFLASEAAALGITTPVPDVRRDTLLDRDGRRISFIDYGTGGPEVTFLHGAGLNAHTWDSTAMALGRPAIAIDLPGHGDSDWREDADYRANPNAEAVWAVMEKLGADCQILVGQSLGGLTGAVIAATNPGAVCGLVVVDITPGIDLSGGASQIRDFLAGASDFASRDEIVDRARSFGIGTSREAVERGVELNTRVRDDGRVVFKHHLANLGARLPLFDTDFTPVWAGLERLTIPVLLVRASRGFLSDDNVAEFLARVPGSTSITIESGHNIQEDAPLELAAAIAAFTADVNQRCVTKVT